MKLTDKFFINERYSLVELLNSSLQRQTIRNRFNYTHVTNSSLCRVVFKSECSIDELLELASQSRDVMTSKWTKKSNYPTTLTLLNHSFTVYTSKASYQLLIKINADTVKKVNISIEVGNNENDNQFDLSREEFDEIEELFHTENSSDNEDEDDAEFLYENNY